MLGGGQQGERGDAGQRGVGGGHREGEVRGGAGAALAQRGPGGGVGRGAQALQRRAGRGGDGPGGQVLEVGQRGGGDEQRGGAERRERALVPAQPVRAERRAGVVEQGEDDQRGGRERHGGPAGAQVQGADGVEVRGGGPLLGERGVRVRGGQQRGRGGSLGDRPDPLGGTGDEDGGEQGVRGGAGGGTPRGRGRVRGREPDHPPGGEADQHGAQGVRAQQRPAAVQLRGDQPVQRAEQGGAEQHGGGQPGGEHRGHGERHAARKVAELPPDHRRDHRQHEQGQQAEPVRGAADQLGRPQPPVRAQPEQRAGPLTGAPGGCDLGEVGRGCSRGRGCAGGGLLLARHTVSVAGCGARKRREWASGCPSLHGCDASRTDCGPAPPAREVRARDGRRTISPRRSPCSSWRSP